MNFEEITLILFKIEQLWEGKKEVNSLTRVFFYPIQNSIVVKIALFGVAYLRGTTVFDLNKYTSIHSQRG